jgi:hypothetical protein
MTVGTVAGIKDRSPRAVLDLANSATRAFGLATADWRVLPDFLIVGTKRGGTTSLWSYLDAHPQVLSMYPRPRGLKSTDYFFDADPDRLRWYRSHFHTDVYRGLRRRRHDRVVNGEASPYYMYGHHIPRMIAGVVPQARLIVLLRNPVERAYSHFQERVKQGEETLCFDEALEEEQSRIAGRHAHRPTRYLRSHDFYSYRDRGIYLPQLQRIYAAFPQHQVLVLQSEDLYANPQRVFDETCEFLGIRDMSLGEPRIHNQIKRAPLSVEKRAELVDFYRPHNERLYEFLGRDFGWDH